MKNRRFLALSLLPLLSACSSGGEPSSSNDSVVAASQAISDSRSNDDADDGPVARVRHVLLISVDGLHETDAARYIAANPLSTLAQLARTGIEYKDAHTPTPSDSFPGLVALVTGGSPKT